MTIANGPAIGAVTAAAIGANSPTDSLFLEQWHLGLIGRLGATALIGLERIWSEYRGQGIHVGIWDTGVQASHADLDDNYDASREIDIAGIGVNDGLPIAGTGGIAHGTNVAGLIAAERNGIGGVGVAYDAKVTGITVFGGTYDINDEPSNYQASLLEGLGRFDVTNHSYGNSPFFFTTEADVLAAFANSIADGRAGLGTIHVKAAGNDHMNSNTESMRSSRFVISVAATDANGRMTYYSSYGTNVLVAAPAGAVTTDLIGSAGYSAGDYNMYFNGTSAASPVTVGLVSLMLSANGGLGWRDVQNILANSAIGTGTWNGGKKFYEKHTWGFNGSSTWNGGGMHISDDYGYGTINAFQAVRMAEVWSLFKPAQVLANEWSLSTGLITVDQPIASGAPTTVSFTIDSDLALEHVDLTLTLQHQVFPEVRIQLISPSGTTATLLDGLAGINITALNPWSYSFGIQTLRGESATGIWQLKFWDSNPARNTGTLESFELSAYGAATSADDVYTYTDEVLTVLAQAGQSGRMVLTDTDGGVDWINAAAMYRALVIDLNGGSTSRLAGQAFMQIAAGTVIENAVGGDGNDVIRGNGAANDLRGMRGDDTLTAGAGDDRVEGGAGNDWLIGGLGSDTLLGGGGEDTLSAGSGDSVDGGDGSDLVRLDFDRAGTTAQVVEGGGYVIRHFDDVLSVDHVEKVGFLNESGTFDLSALPTVSDTARVVMSTTETSYAAPDDGLRVIVTGNAADNTITGGRFDDTLNGGDGNDTLTAGTGADRIDGGYGVDIVSYAYAERGIRISLADKSLNANEALYDRLLGIEGVIGTQFDDTITGGGTDAVLFGLGGSDRLVSMLGADLLDGGDGNDVLDANLGADTVIGGLGDDTFILRDLKDVVVEDADGGQDTAVIQIRDASFRRWLGADDFEVTGSRLKLIATGESIDLANIEIVTFAGGGSVSLLKAPSMDLVLV